MLRFCVRFLCCMHLVRINEVITVQFLKVGFSVTPVLWCSKQWLLMPTLRDSFKITHTHTNKSPLHAPHQLLWMINMIGSPLWRQRNALSFHGELPWEQLEVTPTISIILKLQEVSSDLASASFLPSSSVLQWMLSPKPAGGTLRCHAGVI